uniref:Carbonic anhydrase n=1 Tax=Guillardia theta (strain CCMP2712) TaxID=905079 RepID=A0A0C3U2B9_GUITC
MFEKVFEKNKHWARSKRAADPEFFEKLARGQSPSILWIGCSDARVPANVIIGADSGTVFVQRNIANQFLAIDINAQAVLQYAIEFLQVPHIVVCGHYDCGGVRAALRNMNHGSPLENWLRNIRDVWRLHYDEIVQFHGEARVRRLVELNVVEQCLNVYKTASVQKRRWETLQKDGKILPQIHGLVYDVANGELKKLPVKQTLLLS